MERFNKIILNCVLLLSLNNLYNSIQSLYPKVIIENYSTFSPNIIFSFIIWFIYSFYLIMIFKYDEYIFSLELYRDIIPHNKSAIAVKLLLLFVLQMLYDLAISYLQTISLEWRYLLIDIITYIHWATICFLIIEKNKLLSKNNKASITVLCTMFFVIFTSIVLDVLFMFDYNTLTAKFQLKSPYLLQYTKNADFLFKLKMYFVDIFIVCSGVIYHFCKIKSKKKNINTVTLVTRFCVCLTALLIICSVLNAVFYYAFPQNLLVVSKGPDSSKQSFQEGSSFDYYNKKISVLQKNDNTSLFAIEQIWLYKNDLKKVKFTFNTFEPHYIAGDFVSKVHYKECKIPNKITHVYWNDAICFYEDNKPCLVKISNLNKTPQNDTVTSVCKKLLENGNLFVFEYGYDYLTKYANEFIEPYISRYSEGIFTHSEIQWLEQSFYNKDYIVDIANSIK